MIYLQTLGRVELRTADGKRVRAVQRRPKDLALLTYLAVAGRFAPQRRDALLALFWPDLDPAHGRNALSQALHRLRAALPSGTLIVEGREEVGVSAAQLACDALSFEARLTAGELGDALQWYGGDFLAGFHAPAAAPSFDDWIATERERLERRALHALLVVSESEEKSGRTHVAIGWLRRAVEIRPCDEALCRRLIEALLVVGDRSAAIAEYERFAACLRDECGLSPSRETRALSDAAVMSSAANGHSGGLARHVPDAAAREAFLKGRYFTSTFEQTARGLEYLHAAIGRDPNYAAAYAATALALANVAIMGHLEPQDARERATAAATRALRCDSRLGNAHTAVAMTAMLFDWDWDRAEREFRTGISLDPHSSDAHAYFAQFLCAVGRPDEALPVAHAAHRLDPLGLWSNFVLGWALFRARRHDESIKRLRDVLEVYPHFAFAHLFVAENLLARGARPEAVEACETALGVLPEDQLLLGLTACVSGLSGERELSRRLLERLEAIARSRYVCPGHLAAAHLGVGEYERAFEYWEMMCRERAALACLVPADPLYDCVRGDSRFVAIFARLRGSSRDESVQRS